MSSALRASLFVLLSALAITGCAVEAEPGDDSTENGAAQDEALFGKRATCQPRFALGADCSKSSDGCAAGLYCADSTKRCTKLPTIGQACANGAQCASGFACTQDGESGVCRTMPGAGEACGFGLMGPFLCKDGLGCEDATNTCRPLPTIGQRCTIDSRCAAPYACDWTAEGSFCRVRKAEGGACQNNQICRDGLFCDFSTGACARLRAAGSKCSAGNECVSGLSCNPPTWFGSWRCGPKPALGRTCGFDCAGDALCR